MLAWSAPCESAWKFSPAWFARSTHTHTHTRAPSVLLIPWRNRWSLDRELPAIAYKPQPLFPPRGSYKPVRFSRGTAGGMVTERCPHLEGPHWFFLTGAQKMRCLSCPEWRDLDDSPALMAPPRPLNRCLSTRWNEELQLWHNCILSPRYATT